MKILSGLFILFTSMANACLVLHGTFDNYELTIDAILIDNGRHTCSYSGKIDQDHYFADCIPTFSSYIQKDLNIVAYSNNGHEYTFAVNKERYNPNPQIDHWVLTANVFGC
jgi:hypothetical protein